jgi:hypothetical protein
MLIRKRNDDLSPTLSWKEREPNKKHPRGVF